MNKTFYWGLGAGIVLVILIVIGLASYNALYNLSGDKFTIKVAKLVGLPAGFINGHYVSYADFQDDLRAVQNFYDFQKKQNPDFATPGLVELQTSVWQRLVRQVILEEQAELAQIVISQKDLNKEFEKVIKELGSAENAEKMLDETYGWNSVQFKENVLMPFLLQEKLTKASSTLDMDDLFKRSKMWKWIKI